MKNARLGQWIAPIAGYLLVWLALDYLSFLFENAPGVSPWYLPHGFSLAFLAVFGPAYTPLLLLGPLINGWLFWLPGEPLALVFIAASIMLGYGTGGALLYRWRLDPNLASIRDALIFLTTGLAASLVVAPLAVGGLIAGGVLERGEFFPVSAMFWAGDTLGVFGLGPLFLLLAAYARGRLYPETGLPAAPEMTPAPGSTALFAAQAVVFCAVIAFSLPQWGMFQAPPLYLLFIPVVWLAFSHGIRGAILGVVLSNVVPLLFTGFGLAALSSLADLQLKLAVVSIAGITVGAAVTESRRRAEETARSRAAVEASRRNERMLWALGERVKELQCLYQVSQHTANTVMPLEEACTRTVDALRRGWQFPEVTGARIELRGTHTATANFRGTPWYQSSPIFAEDGQAIGEVTVVYLEERPAADEGPFLKEERDLIDAVALHLGQMVTQRDTTARLAQSERLAAIGQLTGGIAHDFNNLLTVILGNLDSAGDHGDARLQAYLENATRGAERAAELTRRLLAFSQRQPLTPETAGLNDLVGNMRKLLERTLGEDIRIETRLSENAPTVRIDAAQLESAVLNLALNARDAMPQGGHLSIEADLVSIGERTDALGETVTPGDYAVLRVRDTGAGIEPERVRKVFEPFFTTKDERTGNGLGLSVVYGFMKQSGGFVSVESQPGQGTAFGLHIPLEDGAGEAPAATGEKLVPEAGREESILVVEDQSEVLDYITSVLRSAGYRVLTAEDAEAALHLLDTGPQPDLLVTDIVLPGAKNGTSLAEEAGERNPGLPVLYTSGYAFDVLAARSAVKEDVDLITKPFRRHDLLKRVRAALARAQGPAGASA